MNAVAISCFAYCRPTLLSNCNQQSNQAGSTLSDEFDPDPPLITAVQVDYVFQEANRGMGVQ